MKKVFLLLFLLLTLYTNKAKATHLLGGEIQWKDLGNDTFEVNLILYRKCTDGVSGIYGYLLLSKSDSCANSYSDTLTNLVSHTVEDITPVCPGVAAPCNGTTYSSTAMPSGIERHTFKYKYFLGGSRANCCWYKISFNQCCRVIEISNGYSNADFTITCMLNRCQSAGDDSPKFKEPIVFLCINQVATYDNGATDADGDSLSYAFAAPLGGSFSGSFSASYPIACAGGNNPNPLSNPPSGFNLNPITGVLSFQPNSLGFFAYKIDVFEWRTVSGVKKIIGKTSRDLVFITMAGCQNAIPLILPPTSFDVCVNHLSCVPIITSGYNNTDTVRIYIDSNTISNSVFTNNNNNAKFASGTLCWTPDTSEISNTPYTFVITAIALHCTGSIKYLYKRKKTYYITVKSNVVSTYSKKKLNCRDYDFIASINSSSSNTNTKSVRWYINNVQVPGATKVYTGDSLRYRFHRFGIYTIRMEMDAGGLCTETKYDTIQIDTVNNLMFTISNDTTFCYGDSVTLKALNITNGTPPFRYKWFADNIVVDTNAIFKVSPKNSKRYRCEITTSDSCTDFVMDSVMLFTSPNHNPIPDKTICQYVNTTFINTDTSTTDTYTWYFNGNAISTQKNITVSDSGKYIQKIVSGTCTMYDTVALKYLPPPIFTPLNDTFFCTPNGFVTLNMANYNIIYQSYAWFRHDTMFSIVPNPVITDTGTIVVRAYSQQYGCIRYDTLFVGSRPYPIIPTPLTNKTFCSNDSVLLTINDTSTSNTYLWKRNGVNFSTSKNIYAKLAGVYSITVTSAGGCKVNSTDTLFHFSLPYHTKISNRSICSGDSTLLLNIDSNYTFEWYFNNNFISNNKSIYAKVAGIYVQKITNLRGCSVLDSINVIVNSYPIHNDIGNINICPGDTAYIQNTDTSTTYTYSWYRYIGSTPVYMGNSKSITVVDSGMYFVSVVSNGCTKYDSVKVSMYPGISHIKIANTSYCKNDSVLLLNSDNATNVTYQWYFKGNVISTSKSIYVKDSGIYILKIQNSYGCIKFDTVRVKANKWIYHSFFPDNTICNGDKLRVINTDTCIYTSTWLYNGNFFSNSRNVDLSNSGVYIFNMYNNVGCTLSDTIVLSVIPTPSHTKLTGGTICTGDSVKILNTDSSQYSFEWSLNGVIISNQQSIFANKGGKYIQKIIRSNGCYVKDSVNVYEIPRPTHTPLLDMYICNGDSVITQNTDSSQFYFAWFVNGAYVSNQKNIYVKNAGTYVVRVSGVNICLVWDTFQVFLTTSPYHISIPDVHFCIGDSAYLINNYLSSNTYRWYFGGNLISNQKNIATKTTGEYVVKVQSPAGCILFDTVEVYQHNFPDHYKIPNQIICPYDSVLVKNIDSSQYTCEWYNNGIQISTQKDFYLKNIGTFVNKVTNTFGCSIYDTFYVSYSANYPQHYPISDQSFCENDSAWLFNIDSSTYNYTWYFAGNIISHARNIYVNTPGEYIVRVGNFGPCAIYDTVEVNNYTKPIFSLIPLNPTIKKGNSINIVGSDTSYIYQWFGNNIVINWGDSVMLKPATNSSYKVIAHTSNNCIDSMNFTVTVDNTGLNNNTLKNSIYISPNPASKVLFLKKDFKEPCLIRITDNIGKILTEEEWQETQTAIDISQFAEGIYFVLISNSNFSENYKFMKKEE